MNAFYNSNTSLLIFVNDDTCTMQLSYIYIFNYCFVQSASAYILADLNYTLTDQDHTNQIYTQQTSLNINILMLNLPLENWNLQRFISNLRNCILFMYYTEVWDLVPLMLQVGQFIL